MSSRNPLGYFCRSAQGFATISTPRTSKGSEGSLFILVPERNHSTPEVAIDIISILACQETLHSHFWRPAKRFLRSLLSYIVPLLSGDLMHARISAFRPSDLITQRLVIAMAKPRLVFLPTFALNADRTWTWWCCDLFIHLGVKYILVSE